MHLLIRFHQFFQSSGCRAGVGDRIIYKGGGGGGGGGWGGGEEEGREEITGRRILVYWNELCYMQSSMTY